MKTLTKVLESMLTKPATPTWTNQDASPSTTVAPQFGPTQIWGWNG